MTLRPLLAAALVLACSGSAFAQTAPLPPPPGGTATNLSFQPIDPTTTSQTAQVFVADKNAQAESDDRGVVHGPGLRRPRSDDEPSVELFNSEGTSLLFTLEKWRAASGTADVIAAAEGGSRVVAQFRRLIAYGRYSLFARVQNADGTRLAPLDGTGAANSFEAAQDGTASAVVTSPQRLTPGTQIVLVYHSDAADHGVSPGETGKTAHQQLVTLVR